MAASDPTRRREAASIAVRARLAGLTPAERRDMTTKARETLRARDLERIDNWARRAGRYPLPAAEREARADGERRKRALTASQAATVARAQRVAMAALTAAQAAQREADRHAALGIGVDPSLAQMAARR